MFGVVLTLGMAFAETVRCLVFLTIPSMFSKKGRTFLLLYATVLVFSYPAANISTNLKVRLEGAERERGERQTDRDRERQRVFVCIFVFGLNKQKFIPDKLKIQ